MSQCAVEFIDPNKKIQRGLSSFPSKVFIGDSESVETIILHQRPLGVTSQSATAHQPKWPNRPVLTT